MTNRISLDDLDRLVRKMVDKTEENLSKEEVTAADIRAAKDVVHEILNSGLIANPENNLQGILDSLNKELDEPATGTDG